MSPTKVDVFPGSWTTTLPWAEIAEGGVWCITDIEMSEAGVKMESVRVAAHEYAKSIGIKFRTRVVEGDLYIESK